jgi:type IV pilus assembly protein PilB
MLVENGLITAEDLAEALEHQRHHGGRLGSVLVALGRLSEEELESNLGRQLGLAVCDVESVHPSAELSKLVPERLIRLYEVLPIAIEGRTLHVGMVDPANETAIEELKFVTRCTQVVRRLVTETTFRRFLATRYASAQIIDEALGDIDFGAARRGPGPDDAYLAPVVRLTAHLLQQAVQARASDIHIEPYETFFRIRFRVDGCMYTVMTPPARLHGGLTSRIKILSEMDIAERRKPQDGHMTLEHVHDTLHFRVSVLPTVYGEKVVIRLLKKEAHLADLGRLGFDQAQLTTIKRAAKLPQGLVLVTGPTGSGKTTTLHAVLNHINDPEINIVTIEDPVETTIPGINHVQTSERGGVTFAAALRSILRQDPDVIFVGEMRDREVSEIAIKAAMTGHLVFSTLHTNGVLESFGRLADMGLESYLLASCVKLVVAQRLLRRLCSKCAERTDVTAQQVERFQLTPEQVRTGVFRRAVGCRACLETGYRGRTAVYEILEPDDVVRAVLRRGGREDEIAAAVSGMRWMWDSGCARALAGETSLDEVERMLTRVH